MTDVEDNAPEEDDIWDMLNRGTIPANPPYQPSSVFPPGFFAQPTQPQEERGRTRERRAKRNTTGIPWIDRRQPPVPPPDTPQMPQPSPDNPMHTPPPPPTQTRPSDETKFKKKGTKQQQERGRSRRPKWKRNDADTGWINAHPAPLQPSDTPQAPPPSQSRPSDEMPYARSRTPDRGRAHSETPQVRRRSKAPLRNKEE